MGSESNYSNNTCSNEGTHEKKKTGWKFNSNLSFTLLLIAVYLFTVFFNLTPLWPNSGYWCCVSFTLRISLLYPESSSKRVLMILVYSDVGPKSSSKGVLMMICVWTHMDQWNFWDLRYPLIEVRTHFNFSCCLLGMQLWLISSVICGSLWLKYSCVNTTTMMKANCAMVQLQKTALMFPENEGTRVRGDFFFLLLSFKRTDFGMGGLFS